MTKSQLEIKIKELKERFEKDKIDILKKFCIANNPYKVGDVVKDHMGSIIIEKIKFATYTISGTPECVYYGPELKKDGKPRKDGSKRNVWQSNILK